jgi:hypothetical protein
MDIPLKTKQGLRLWKNSGNGFAVAELHYSADPSKSNPEWKTQQSQGLDPKRWAIEMELARESFAGHAVYSPPFDKSTHVLRQRREPDPDCPMLLRGWDFGGDHSILVCQFIDDTLYVIDEFPNMGFNTRIQGSKVLHKCSNLYGENWHWRDWIDPAGVAAGKESDGKACADVMRELGLKPEWDWKSQTISRRLDSVMQLLSTTNKHGTSRLQVNPQCHMIIRGLEGGYHYPENQPKNQKHTSPDKNEFSHIMNCLEYLAHAIVYERLNKTSATQQAQVGPKLNYRFD